MRLKARVWMAAAAVLSGSMSGTWFAVHAQSPQPDAQRAAEMREHYWDAMAMHTAVIRGDLAAVAASAQSLTQYAGPPGMPDRAAGHVVAIRRAAAEAATAPNVVVAATSSAVMLNACGQCHRAVGAHPSLSLRVAPELGGVVGHMLAHQRAADQIFQGLVVPSDALWRAGARALASAPLHSAELPVGALEGRKLARTEQQIHRVATDAAQATEPRARANYYGQMLAGCADCHRRSAKWGPRGQ